jgi:hypothetical protein
MATTHKICAKLTSAEEGNTQPMVPGDNHNGGHAVVMFKRLVLG